ncbi:MAG: FAD-binding protein [Rhizobiaceae bacterium]
MTGAGKLLPDSEEAAAAMVAEAAGIKRTLAIEGGGSKSNIGRPMFADNTISSANYSGISHYDPAEMVISAKAGTSVKLIESELANKGQRLAFEPMDYRNILGSDGEPTIGAVAAINNSGPHRIVAGAARDSLLGVRFVNGRGEIITNGGRVMKNVTGLDLVKLLAGSWGTLGFLTEVTFKVLPAPETQATLLLLGLDDDESIRAMAQAMAGPDQISGVAHVPELASQSLLDCGAATALRIEGFAESVSYRLGRLRSRFKDSAAIEVLDEKATRRLWIDLRDVKPFAGKATNVWRVSMKPSQAAKFVMAIRMEAAADAYYDWQGGLVWLSIEGPDPQDQLIRNELTKHGGGHATLVRADEQVRLLVPVFQPEQEPVKLLSQRIKHAFDPSGVFNPGRMAA